MGMFSMISKQKKLKGFRYQIYIIPVLKIFRIIDLHGIKNGWKTKYNRLSFNNQLEQT